MKARNKETGSVLKVTGVWLEDGSMVKPDKIEFLLEEGQYKDLEKRRFELVKAAMQGYISNEGREYMHTESSMKNTAELCVKFADAVLAEYNKGSER